MKKLAWFSAVAISFLVIAANAGTAKVLGGKLYVDEMVQTGYVDAGTVIANNYLGPNAIAAWARTATPCDGGAGTSCSLADSYNVTSVTEAGTGVFTVTFPTMGDTSFGVLATPTTSGAWCTASAASATTATVTCFQVVIAVPAYDFVEVPFTVMVMDSN